MKKQKRPIASFEVYANGPYMLETLLSMGDNEVATVGFRELPHSFLGLPQDVIQAYNVFAALCSALESFFDDEDDEDSDMDADAEETSVSDGEDIPHEIPIAAKAENVPPVSNEERRMWKENRLGMPNREILHNNKFMLCKKADLLTLWDALKVFYTLGYVDDESPLRPFYEAYVNDSRPGMASIDMENDLLKAIAVEFARIR